MKKVDVNAYLSGKSVALRGFLIFIILTSTLYLSYLGLDAYSLQKSVAESSFFKGITTAFGAMDDKRQEVKDREMLDKGRLIGLGDKDMNISIDAYNSELDTGSISNPEKNDFGGHYPAEVAGAAQETYDEKIPEEYKDAVKDYFKKIAK